MLDQSTNADLAAACFHAQGSVAPSRPTLAVDPALHAFWPQLLDEEVSELREALHTQDLVEVADALADILYVAYQAAASYGIPIDAVFREVHRSNLAKVSPDGLVIRRADGKVMKPAGWTPPDVARVLNRAGR